MKKVLIPLAEGFEEIETITIVDVLRRGNVSAVLASISQELCVKGAHGVEIKADVLLSEVSGDDFAAVVLPGGAGGTEKLRVCDVLKDILWRHKENGAIIAAICAAPIVLVDFELLDREHHITCYPSVVTEIDRPSANAPVVADGNVITGQGPASAMLFALVLLSALEGEVKARKVSRGVLFDGF